MKAKKVNVEALGIGNNGFHCLQAIVEAYTNYKIVAQEEQTKRRNIANWEKTTIAQIKAQRDIMILYLDRSFDERAHNFGQLFEKVDQAINNGDNNQLTLVLNSITELAKSSPFKNLADLTFVENALHDRDHKWEC